MEEENKNTKASAESGDASVSGRNKKGDHTIQFLGSYQQYLGLSLYNLLLTVLTLGLYYPWAKSAIRKFLWQETEVAGSRFEWHGTGKEMFRGFIKVYLVLGVIFLILNFGHMFIPPEHLIWVVMVSYLFILALIPLAIHGMMRYRLSRSSYRGIHFGYRGVLGTFYKKTSIDFLLTMVTFGIYGAWLQTNIRRYVLGHARFGNVEGRFDGTGGQFFWLSFSQGLLTMITLYLYFPWAIIEFFKFHVNNTKLVQDGQVFTFKTNATGGQYLWVAIKAILLTVITLGIAGPVAQLMIHKYFTDSLSISGGFDFEKVEQTEDAYTDATGDDMMDALDLGF